MAEHGWHKKVREATVEELKKKKFIVYSSHTDYSKLELFRNEVKRENCLSDADIVVFDSKHRKIRQIIKVETAMNPKKLIGIVLATHFCNLCRIRKKDYPLRNISLKIVCKKAKKKSKKGMKLDVIRESLDDIIKTTEGSLSNFEMREYKE